MIFERHKKWCVINSASNKFMTNFDDIFEDNYFLAFKILIHE